MYIYICIFLVIILVLSIVFLRRKRIIFNMVTVSSNPDDPRLQLLLRSATEKGWFSNEDRIVLRCDVPFSWAKRLALWRDYYSSLPHNAVVLSVDAFDVLVMASKKEILCKFLRMNTPLLFGCTDYCWPEECAVCQDRLGFYSEKRQHLVYLCAGTYIGRAGYLADLLHKYTWTDDVDDQCYFSTVALQEKDIRLDDENQIFQSSTPTALRDHNLIPKNGRFFNTATHSYPCVFHFDSFHPSFESLLHAYTHSLVLG